MWLTSHPDDLTDKDNKRLARNDRRRMAALGNRLWHSDATFRIVPARYSLLSAREVSTADPGIDPRLAAVDHGIDAVGGPVSKRTLVPCGTC